MTPRIEDIKNKIAKGYSLVDLQKDYPITLFLFKKLGGKNFSKRIKINNDILKIITGNDLISKDVGGDKLDRELIVANLLGDGNAFSCRKFPDTCSFSFGHTLKQIGYVKLKYELLKPFVTRIRLAPREGERDYSLHVNCKQLPLFMPYYKLFYTANKSGKINVQKDVLKDDIISLINPRILAFWIMDDGKKYGKAPYMFSLTVGKQPYYSYAKFKDFVNKLSDKLCTKLQAVEEKISYEIRPLPETSEQIFDSIREYIWPYFCYKFNVTGEICGSFYRDLPWFNNWQDTDKYVKMFNM